MNAKTALKGKKRIKNCFTLLDCKTTNSYDFPTARHSKSVFFPFSRGLTVIKNTGKICFLKLKSSRIYAKQVGKMISREKSELHKFVTLSIHHLGGAQDPKTSVLLRLAYEGAKTCPEMLRSCSLLVVTA